MTHNIYDYDLECTLPVIDSNSIIEGINILQSLEKELPNESSITVPIRANDYPRIIYALRDSGWIYKSKLSNSQLYFVKDHNSALLGFRAFDIDNNRKHNRKEYLSLTLMSKVSTLS